MEAELRPERKRILEALWDLVVGPEVGERLRVLEAGRDPLLLFAWLGGAAGAIAVLEAGLDEPPWREVGRENCPVDLGGPGLATALLTSVLRAARSAQEYFGADRPLTDSMSARLTL